MEYLLNTPFIVVKKDYIVNWDETEKTQGPVSPHVWHVWHDKTPPCIRAVSAEQRLEFCSPSPAIVTSSCERNILECDVKQQTINQQPSTHIAIIV